MGQFGFLHLKVPMRFSQILEWPELHEFKGHSSMSKHFMRKGSKVKPKGQDWRRDWEEESLWALSGNKKIFEWF